MKVLFLLLSLVIFAFANDIGFIDDITINDREFDSLQEREIEFYQEDLIDGKVVVKGLLESEDTNTSVDELSVEITTDGGTTWSKAIGHADWEWSFTPELGNSYQFSLRVVKDTQTSTTPPDSATTLPTSLTIAGFTLSLDSNVSFVGGKITGSGHVEIPYLTNISSAFTTNTIDVDFSNLTVSGNSISMGDITYDEDFTINTPIADITIDQIVLSPNVANTKIEGEIVFKNQFSSFGTQSLPTGSKFLPTSFAINIPFTSKTINIWEEQGVALNITNGSIGISYTAGDSLPKVNFNIPNAQFTLGELLKYANNVSAEVGMGDFGLNPTITLPHETYLLGSGIKLPAGMTISLDLNDYTDPTLSFSTPVDLSEYDNPIANTLNNATINANISKTGLNATITTSSPLSPITILDRGSQANNVKLIFDGSTPTISMSVTNSNPTPSFSISGVTPKIKFGNLLKDAAGSTSEIMATISDFNSPIKTINIPTSLKLLGSNITLPNGFNATIDLTDMSSPQISFENIAVDFSAYDNIITQHISGALMSASISRAGFSATVTANKPTPIDIYSAKDVKLIFNGSEGPSFSINISGSDPVPKLHISDIDAKLDFGTLMHDVNDASNNILADVGVITQDNKEVLQLSLPAAKVKLLDSNVAFEGIVASLNLDEKRISIASSIDLSGYGDNAILQALTGSRFDATISTTGFSGSVTVEDELEPIMLLASKNVKLNVTGTPSITIVLQSDNVSFDFGQLNASIDFGDLLKDLSNNPASAILSSAANSSGEYTVNLNSKVKLLGSQFALQNTQIALNINTKSLSLASTVDLSAYTSPAIQAFNGASFNATVSTSGFSGTLTKSGGLEPIVILARGGVGKDVSLNFTTSPTIGISLANSGIEFNFDGGSADLKFGDLLSNANAVLAGVDGENGVYSWSLSGSSIPLYSGSKAKINSITNGRLDIQDITDPKISFSASIDLHEYGGVVKNVNNAQLQDVMISKAGFSASLSANLGTVDIWQEKNVKLSFTQDPTIQISLGSSGVNMGFSNLAANLDFGDLLPPNSIANIVNTMPTGNDSSQNQNSYTWSIDGRKQLFSKNIFLSNLGGSIDISDFSNPSITLSAMVDFTGYDNPIFEHITSAQLSDVTISKNGFSGSLATSLTDIMIWQDKQVKVIFNPETPPTFTLNIDSGGLKLGAQNLTASISLGSLLNNSNASLNSVGNNIYQWSIAGTNPLGSTGVSLSGLHGSIDFSDLKDPTINLNATADVSTLSSAFQGVELQNGVISKNGFSGDLSANMNDISIYKEGEKEIMLKFATNSSPTVHLALTRDNFSIGISDLQANFKFTKILDDQELSLNPVIVNGERQKGIYSWGLQGSHEFLNDSKGIVPVTDLGGTIDLNDWSNPKVSFHTSADFSNYNLIPNVNLGTVSVTNAVIQKTKIEWNLSVQNASANLKILELGEGADDDVRITLENVQATVGTDGTSFDGGDGRLHLGKLFDGNKQATLSSNSNDGLKSYSFAFSEDVVYRKDDNNFITFKNLSGNVIEQSDHSFKVTLGGQAIVRSSILDAISIDELTFSGLEISSAGFIGNINATWNDYSINVLDGRAALILREIGIHIDTSSSDPITLNTFDGNINLDSFFDGEDLPQANLEFVNSSINWNFGQKVFTLKGSPNYIFKNLSGTLNLASLNGLSIGLAGTFGYKGIENDITLSDFIINSSGVAGTVTLNGSVDIVEPDLKLTSLSITFAGDDTSGTAGVSYSNSSFLGTGESLDIGLLATADKTGLREFSVNSSTTGTNQPPSVDIANFAKLNFTKVTASPSLEDFWISLDGTVQPKNKLFGANVALEFEGLKISKTGISITSAGGSTTTSGTEAKLGGLTVNVEKVGLGFEQNLFYINIAGGLAIPIAKAKADVKLYSNKTLKVNDIAVNISKSGLTTAGSLKWFDEDPVYGDGFKATLNLDIANTLKGDGLFQLGKINNLFYWQANFQGGAGKGIPLGSSGLSMYAVGGGIAHNMSFNPTTKVFIPSAGTTGLILSTNLGTTSDQGLMWNGDIKITAEISNGTLGQLSLIGKSWVFSKTRGEHPSKRTVNATITYATNPNSLQITADASVEYKKIKVIGGMDILISSSEKHVFIGTDADYAYAFNITTALDHVRLTIFDQQWDGFLMADDDAMAIGAGIQIDKEWKKKWKGPDPTLKLILHAGAKTLLIYRPTFQMNVDVGVEVTLKACYGGCLTAGADVLIKLATPNPEYLYAKTTVSVPGKKITFDGYIYGSGDLLESSDEPTFTILDHLEPNEDKISLMPIFKVYSKFVTAQPITITIYNMNLKDTTTGENTSLIKFDLDSDDERKGNIFIPTDPLTKNHNYLLTGTMSAIYEEDGETQTKTVSLSKSFKTKNSNALAFSDFINSITPLNNAQNIHEDEGVKIHYNKHVVISLGGTNNTHIRDYVIELYDADNNKIYGNFTQLNSDYIAKFKPSKSLRIYRYCVNSEGIIKETFLDAEGHFLNPFNGYTVDTGTMPNDILGNNINIPNSAATANGVFNSLQNSGAVSYQTPSTSTAPQNNAAQVVAASSLVQGSSQNVDIQASINIPDYIRREAITLKTPQALGKFVIATRDNNGHYFRYYRSSEYTIHIRHVPTNTVKYRSKFEVRYNNIPAEAKRKIEQMQESLDPTFTVSLDENRIGSSAIRPNTSGTRRSSSNDSSEASDDRKNYFENSEDFFNVVRVVVNDGLEDIGVNGGVTTKILVDWELLLKNGSMKTIRDVWESDETQNTLNGVVMGYNAKIQYISQIDNRVILEMPMRLISGEPFNSFDEMMRGSGNKFKGTSYKDMKTNGFVGEDNGGFQSSTTPSIPMIIDDGAGGGIPIINFGATQQNAVTNSNGI